MPLKVYLISPECLLCIPAQAKLSGIFISFILILTEPFLDRRNRGPEKSYISPNVTLAMAEQDLNL